MPPKQMIPIHFRFDLVDTKEGNVYYIVWIFKIVLEFFFLSSITLTPKEMKSFSGNWRWKKKHKTHYFGCLLRMETTELSTRSYSYSLACLLWLIHFFIQHITLPMALLLSNAMFYIPFCQCTVYVCRHARNYYKALFFFVLLNLLLFHCAA